LRKGVIRITTSEKKRLKQMASEWGVEVDFRSYLGADMFARITIPSEGVARVEMLEAFSPESYYSKWGNRDVPEEKLFEFLLLHEIAHLKLEHHTQNIPVPTKDAKWWFRFKEQKETEADLWAKRRLGRP